MEPVYAEIKCGRIIWKFLGHILGTHRKMSIEGCRKGLWGLRGSKMIRLSNKTYENLYSFEIYLLENIILNKCVNNCY